jgi:hypothetical protein
VNENGDLQNGIRVQMGQVNVVEIKEPTEKGRDGKAEAAEKKRSVNYRLVGILCRDSSPVANPPRTEFPRRKNPMDTRWRSSASEMMDIWLPAKDNWLLGSIGGITAADELAVFLLCTISIFTSEQSRRRMAERIRKRECKN